MAHPSIHAVVRRSLPSTASGCGQHFSSPQKQRNKRKIQALVEIPGQLAKRNRVLSKMEALLNHEPVHTTPEVQSVPELSFDTHSIDPPETVDHDSHNPDTQECSESYDDGTANAIHHISISSKCLSTSWQSVIPTVIEPFLRYLSQTIGKSLSTSDSVISNCNKSCIPKRTNIVCLYFDRFATRIIISCACASLPQLLLQHGLFPTAPSQPRMAVSVELLAFYRALFERSCDAVNALAAALNTHYIRRGFRITTAKGQAIQEPFRRSLGHAVQWYDILQVEVEKRVDHVLEKSRDLVAAARAPSILPNVSLTPLDSSTRKHNAFSLTSDQRSPSTHLNVLSQGTCASILVQRCPACFAGITFGRPLDQGGDIHVATDGNFHHRHRRSAGDCPPFYEPSYFLPKSQVDDIGHRIDKVRKRPPKKCKAVVPDEAIDQCEASYEAADGKKQKTAMDSFDDTGVMALICRHDIPLFFANIDTPGEQQKYSIALLEHLFSLLPSDATVVTLYDVGCVLSRSLNQYDILSTQIVSRLRFGTTAMHAYGHEWACQLVNNPRIISGLSLSDGEGTERLWSRFIKLIGIQRSSSRQRRIWLIDRQASAIGHEMRRDLGDWLRRRLNKGIKEQGLAAQDVLDECDVDIPELRLQWSNQRKAQLSVRAHAPARLKKELDTVLALQGDLDTSERALQATRTMIEKQHSSPEALDALDSLERSHNRLLNKVDVLYASLNVQDRFPDLDGVDLDFVRTLLMAHDLKINIRKRAIGSFFEWDKLDRAVGGKQKALGMKLHQQTRKAIAKRQPALMASIRKFNKYCQRLEDLYDPSFSIPLPTPIPMKLDELRNDPTFLEDVWINPSVGEIPRWLDDRDVREGIRALLRCERCREEQHRLGLEADNMCRWFGLELASIEHAIRQSNNSIYYLILQQRREATLQLQECWPTPLASAVRYASQAETALQVASSLSGLLQAPQCCWLKPVVCALPEHTLAEEDSTEVFLDIDTSENPNPDELALVDVLAESDTPNPYDDDGDDQEPHNASNVNLDWEIPLDFQIDSLNIATNSAIVTDIVTTRVRPPCDGFPCQTFDCKDIAILTSSDARLNDTCINGCATLLYSAYLSANARRCAILSTHDLPRIRYHATDDVLWRNTSWTNYWEKSIWILPIHRSSQGGHWVVCAVDFGSKRLLLFDSFAQRKSWKADIQDIMRLISRLSVIAFKRLGIIRKDLSKWSARPVVIDPVQSNQYDCGVWVLAQISAILRGYEVTNLQEHDMLAFRYFV